VQRRQKTLEGFERLPEEFTTEDVVRCFNLNSATCARVKIGRLMKDHFIEKVGEFVDDGSSKAMYRKLSHYLI
jgi:hypothetical protein